MLLCVDIGNTNTVLAVFEGESLKHSWRIRTDPHATADELGLTFRALLDGDGVDLTGIALSSTVPQQGAEVAKMVQRMLQLTEPPQADAAYALALALAHAQEQGRYRLTAPKRI